MKMMKMTCEDFSQMLAGESPVPGGGSVSALVGALGAALGIMVGSLTLGKPKYAESEIELKKAMKELDEVRRKLQVLIQEDVDIFEPLSRLYGMKTETEADRKEKDKLMEEALKKASMIPLSIMEQCGRAIELCRIFGEKGNKLAVSDAAAGAVLCKAAIEAASLNVYINTKMMKDETAKNVLMEECEDYKSRYIPLAEDIYRFISDDLR